MHFDAHFVIIDTVVRNRQDLGRLKENGSGKVGERNGSKTDRDRRQLKSIRLYRSITKYK